MKAAIFSALCLLASACARPLPEVGTPQASLYVERCGGCHAPIHPHKLTAAMWTVQVERMEKKFRGAARMPDAAEHDQILDYLTRNAGK